MLIEYFHFSDVYENSIPKITSSGPILACIKNKNIDKKYILQPERGLNTYSCLSFIDLTKDSYFEVSLYVIQKGESNCFKQKEEKKVLLRQPFFIHLMQDGSYQNQIMKITFSI